MSWGMKGKRGGIENKNYRIEEKRLPHTSELVAIITGPRLQVDPPAGDSTPIGVYHAGPLTLPLPLLAVRATVLRRAFSEAASRKVTTARPWSRLRHLDTRLPAGCTGRGEWEP